jgi:hypothetical protein
MGGGLMQLVAYGAQDIYLTGNPQITFFKVVYRRHTNFSMEAIEQTFNGSVGFGSKVSATISRNGDLVHRMYLEASLALNASGDDVYANVGSALINNIELEIGGQRIDKHYGHWMEVWAELTEENNTNHSGTVNNDTAGTRDLGTRYQNMSHMGGVSGQAQSAIANVEKFWVPLQFWFCRNPGLALPLIALQYHEVKVVITFGASADVASAAATITASLWADYIYLDTDERRRFAQVSHEYLIEQLQFTNSGTATSHDLIFNHPCKEIIFTGGVTSTASVTAGPSTPVAPVSGNYKIVLNGHDRFTERDLKYFTRTQVWQHHTGCGGLTLTTQAQAAESADTIGVYSFALKPEEHQPSGTCNFSRIDNAQLKSESGALYIYAVNYNVLRIMSGMGGLAYSN